jgi:putative ABC transport system permease protein
LIDSIAEMGRIKLGGTAAAEQAVARSPRKGSLPSGSWAALGNALLIAVDTLWAHKLRSALTVFGIVIGVAAVVLVGATLGAVRDVAVKTTAQSFGANTFIISQVASVGDLSRKELSDKLRKNPEIYRREAEKLGQRIGDSTLLAPALQSVSDVKAGNRSFLAAAVTGSTAGIQEIRDIKLSTGRFFTDEENRRAQGVAVIGQDLVDELFPALEPLGKQIRIQGRPFQVIGVQEKQGSSFGASLDRNVYIPLMVYEKIWGSRRSVTLYAQPKELSLFAQIQEEARVALRVLRRLRPNADDNFDILTPEAGRSFLGRLTGMIAVAIVPVSPVALIVAGIVVMNMMLVSVTERTHEIGIRKSLGARRRDVLAQILFESTILTMIGGVVGILISYLGTFGLGAAFGAPVGLPLAYGLLALAVAAVIGISAGLYPAYLASRMQPVEALRAET